MAPKIQLQLLWEKVRGRLRYGPARGLALWSAPRLVLNLVVMGALGGLLLWHQTREEKAAEEIFDAFDTSEADPDFEALDGREVEALWRLRLEGPAVQRKLYEKFLASDPNAERYVNHAISLNHAVLGLDPARDQVWLEALLETSCTTPGWPSGRLAACSRLLEEAAASPDFRAGARLIEVLADRFARENFFSFQTEALPDGLKALAPKLTHETAARLAEIVVSRMEEKVDGLALGHLTKVLEALSPRLEPRTAFELARRLATRRGKAEADARALLSRGVAVLSSLLSSEQRLAIGGVPGRLDGNLGPDLEPPVDAAGLLARMRKTQYSDDFQFWLYADLLSELGPSLESRQALDGAELVVERLTTRRRIWNYPRRAVRCLAAFGARITPQQKSRLARQLLDDMRRRDRQGAFVANAGPLAALVHSLTATEQEAVLCFLLELRNVGEIDLCAAASKLSTDATLRWEAEDLLKWPTCMKRQRIEIVRHLAAVLEVESPLAGSDRFDRWAVSAWLQKKGFDVERPPRRGPEALEVCQRRPVWALP